MLQHRAMSAAALEGAGRYTPSHIGSTSSYTSTVSVHPNAQPGDFALLIGSAPVLRSGWSQTYNQGSTLPRFEAHHTFLPDPVPSSYTFSFMQVGILMIFRSVDSSSPFDVDPLVASPLSTTSTPPPVTTINDRCLLVLGFGAYAGIGSGSIPIPPTGYTLTKGAYDSADANYWFSTAIRSAPNDTTYTPTAWQNTATGSDYTATYLATGTIALRGAPI